MKCKKKPKPKSIKFNFLKCSNKLSFLIQTQKCIKSHMIFSLIQDGEFQKKLTSKILSKTTLMNSGTNKNNWKNKISKEIWIT